MTQVGLVVEQLRIQVTGSGSLFAAAIPPQESDVDPDKMVVMVTNEAVVRDFDSRLP